MKEIELEELGHASLEKILVLVHDLTGISMGTNKKTLLQGRLRPRVRKLGLASYDHYLAYLSAHKEEVQVFINLVTTNETYFFRTQRVWDYFSNVFLPKWTMENPNKVLNIWSGASSSGEEIYTIAICCEEYRTKNTELNYQITGTDISSDVLAVANLGEYSGRSIEAFKSSNRQLFDKYMIPKAESLFQVNAQVRSRIKFNLHNLFGPPNVRNFYDIIFLRNVMIYFDSKDQEQVLANIALGLRPGGTLIIGESESLTSLKTPFKYKLPLVYEKVEEGLE